MATEDIKLKLQKEFFVDRSESKKTFIRSEDVTDENVPCLRYNIPLPSSFEGQLFITMDNLNIPWSDKAKDGKNLSQHIVEAKDSTGKINCESLANKIENLDLTQYIPEKYEHDPVANIENIHSSLANSYLIDIKGKIINKPDLKLKLRTVREMGSPESEVTHADEGGFVIVGKHYIPMNEIVSKAEKGFVIAPYKTFGGTINYAYVKEAPENSIDEKEVRPRFVIIEHYKLSSFFGNYGAGKTISTFSLWPGEETRLYIRNWRRTEEKKKEASSIFDSYTTESADEFGSDLQKENSNKFGSKDEDMNKWDVRGGYSGFGASFSAGAEGMESSSVIREEFAKKVGKVSSHHASKASAKRENKVSTEIEVSESQEFETITERNVKNINLSRVLNLVCRELNQEFETYLSLEDISIAFANDKNIFEEAALYEIDRLIKKYVKEENTPLTGTKPATEYVKDLIWEKINLIHDFEGNPQPFIIKKQVPNSDKTYWGVNRRPDIDRPHPFYSVKDDSGKILKNNRFPVEGVVLSKNRHTIKTDAVIIDALLGHGVALDNYALGSQQEVLREKQLANAKTELALELLKSGDSKKIEAFRSLFVYSIGDITDKIIQVITKNSEPSKKEDNIQ